MKLFNLLIELLLAEHCCNQTIQNRLEPIQIIYLLSGLLHSSDFELEFPTKLVNYLLCVVKPKA